MLLSGPEELSLVLKQTIHSLSHLWGRVIEIELVSANTFMLNERELQRQFGKTVQSDVVCITLNPPFLNQ